MSTKWPYLAGILDGEGTICLYHIKNKEGGQHTGLQIRIYGTELKLMKWLVLNFGGRFNVRSQTKLSKKLQYAWNPSGRKNNEKFLLGILPYLVIKTEQAKLALEFLRLGNQTKDPNAKAELVKKCQALNQGDESVTTNTQDNIDAARLEVSALMRESELMGDHESAPVVTQVDQCEEIAKAIAFWS
jgi:hypothetical protein